MSTVFCSGFAPPGIAEQIHERSFAHINRTPPVCSKKGLVSCTAFQAIWQSAFGWSASFWRTAALCYFFGSSTDLIVSLLALGLLSALAKWIVGQRGGE